MRGLQRDKECEIAIRCRVVEAEIEKKMQSFLKIIKSQRRKIQGSLMLFLVNKQFLFSLNKVYACRVSLQVAKGVGGPEWEC